MKFFIMNSFAYFIKGGLLYRSPINCYGICDTQESELVHEIDSLEQEQMIRIWQCLVPVSQVRQDTEQLSLF
jgi:hypothetical protein